MGRDGLGSYNKNVTETITARELDTILQFFDGIELIDLVWCRWSTGNRSSHY
jgi:hypothetical protein